MKVLQCVLCVGAMALVVELDEAIRAQGRKAFEVVSIRPLDQPYTRPPSSRVTPGRVEMTGANAKDVVARAFGDRMATEVPHHGAGLERPFPVYELVVLPSGSKLREVAAVDDLTKPFVSAVGPAIFDSVTGLPGDELRTISAPAGPDNPGGLYYVRSRTSYA